MELVKERVTRRVVLALEWMEAAFPQGKDLLCFQVLAGERTMFARFEAVRKHSHCLLAWFHH
jgi:hypothetical protein